MKRFIFHLLKMILLVFIFGFIMFYVAKDYDIKPMYYIAQFMIVIVVTFTAVQVISSLMRFGRDCKLIDFIPSHTEEVFVKGSISMLDITLKEKLELKCIERCFDSNVEIFRGVTKSRFLRNAVRFTIRVRSLSENELYVTIHTQPSFPLTILDFGESMFVHRILINEVKDYKSMCTENNY